MHQAVKPNGALGVVMGWLLETGNAVQNRATVDALDPPPGAAVLEIGGGSRCWPGAGRWAWWPASITPLSCWRARSGA